MTRIQSLAVVAALVVSPTAWAKTPHRLAPPTPPHAIPPSGELSADDLLAIVQRRLRFHKADAFSPDLNESPLDGRAFRFIRRISGPGGDDPHWRYSAPRLSITLTSTDVSTSLSGKFYGLLLSSTSASRGPSVRQNAFGAKVVVDSYEDDKVVVGATSPGGLPWLTASLSVTPEQARDASMGAYAEFRGTLVANGGAVTICGTDFIEATFDQPTEIGEENCLVSARFTSAEIFSRDGKSLGSWKPEIEQPAYQGPLIWTQRPTGEDMAQYYPERASRMNVNGHATIECTVNANGTVSGCSVVSESPSDQEFGSAALKLSRLFKADPSTITPGQKVTIPVPFQVPND